MFNDIIHPFLKILLVQPHFNLTHNVDINSTGDCGLLGDIPDILKKTSV
jgi:hypothetical protein